MSLELKPLSLEFSSSIYSSTKENVAEYFYNFKNREETEHWVKEAIKEHETGTKEEYVILDGHMFIGMISPRFLNSNEVEIGMWICVEHQGKGYGKAGLQKLIEILKQRNISKVLYVTDVDNEASIRLAESLDFKCEKKSDGLHFSKELT